MKREKTKSIPSLAVPQEMQRGTRPSSLFESSVNLLPSMGERGTLLP